MTLRVTLEIVPHGHESHKYVIGVIDISNLEALTESISCYSAHKYSDGDTLLAECVDGSLTHCRDEGAWTLVRKVLELEGFSK